MSALKDLLNRNQRWAERINTKTPDFFANLAQQQTPKYLWLGCSDSRMPATQIVDMEAGDIFVHRNVANIIVPSDISALAVMQFAIETLKVEHVLVVGHYGCGGVAAALKQSRLGLIDHWLRHVDDVAIKHADKLNPSIAFATRHDRLCELNALEQAINVCHNPIVQDAWKRGQKLTVQAWIYNLENGLLRDLGLNMDNKESLSDAYASVLKTLDTQWRSTTA